MIRASLLACAALLAGAAEFHDLDLTAESPWTDSEGFTPVIVTLRAIALFAAVVALAMLALGPFLMHVVFGGHYGRLGLVAVSYLACVAVATYPAVLSIGTQLPGELTDPLEHLWILRWSRACLLEGRSPFFSDGLQ